MRRMGYARVRRTRKSALLTMKVWGAVEWTGLAVSLRLLSTLFCEMRSLETVKSKGEV